MHSEDIFIHDAQPPADSNGSRPADTAADAANTAFEAADLVIDFTDDEDGASNPSAAAEGTESGLLDALRNGAEEATDGVLDVLGNAASAVGDFISGL